MFAAASLGDAFGELERRFEAQHPRFDVVLNLGGSAELARQLEQGAPADVFAAADERTMRLAADAGAVSAPRALANNSLVLAVPEGNAAGVSALDDLARSDLAVVLCAVEVPCGALAARVLADAGVTASPDSLEQNVRSVLTRLELGEADAGLVYASDVAGRPVAVVPVDGVAAFTTEYQIAAVSSSASASASTGARAFIDFVLSQEGVGVLQRAGLAPA